MPRDKAISAVNIHQEFAAPENLRDSIKCFWYDKTDFGPTPANFDIMPDGYAEIIFMFGSPCYVIDGGSSKPLPSPFIMGLLNQPLVLQTQNVFQIIAIRCYPWAVFPLLNLPPGSSGVNTFHHPIAQLQATLQEYISKGNIEGAIEVVKQYFINAQPRADHTVNKAGAAMRKAKGTMPVRQVAAAAHATVRTLERKFKLSSGQSIKDISGLMRFEQVRNHLWTYPNANLAQVALEFGYTDQSHLSREFKRYSNTTPAAFARKAVRGNPAITNNFVAFVQD